MPRTMKQSGLKRLMIRQGSLTEKERKQALGLVLRASPAKDDCVTCIATKPHAIGKAIADIDVCLNHAVVSLLN